MTDLVQTFNFAVRLTGTPAAVASMNPPPSLRDGAKKPRPQPAAPPGRRTAPPVAAPSPAGGASSGQGQTLGNGGFQECSGLQLEAQVREYAEGGRNDGVARGAGRATLSPIVLKRGMFVADTAGAAALWDWLQGMVTGRLPVVRYDGTVEVFGPQEARADQRRRVVARWTFDAGLPIKVMGPVLNAKTGEIAVEELHIVHEALRLEVSSS